MIYRRKSDFESKKNNLFQCQMDNFLKNSPISVQWHCPPQWAIRMARWVGSIRPGVSSPPDYLCPINADDD